MKTKDQKPTNAPKTSALLKSFRAARNAAAPLVAINTPDQVATIAQLQPIIEKDGGPIFVWDCVRGISAANEASGQLLGHFETPAQLINMTEAACAALSMPADGVIFFMNAHRQIGTGEGLTPNVQAIANLRDPFKSTGRTAVLLAPAIQLGAELETDALLLDEPLPEAPELTEIAKAVYHSGEQPEPDAETIRKVIDATAGLSSFAAEQAVAMSMKSTGLDLETLWERKRQMVEQTRGLAVYRGGNLFANLGGLSNIKGFLTKVIAGKRRPRVIVFIDEIEKAINPEGDLSGVSKDQLGTLLSFMQDNDASGVILIGPPGTGKSELAKAAGNEADAPTVILDINGMKGGIVGESESNIRTALKVCKAIGGDRLLFIATCNSIAQLPPELRRRFTLGTFFMDLPDSEERAAIWKLYLAKFFPEGNGGDLPADDGWTGAEIRQCADLAYSLGIPLIEAANYIVPVAKSAAEKIDALRSQADGRYISASMEGLYQKMPAAAPAAPAAARSGRKLRVG